MAVKVPEMWLVPPLLASPLGTLAVLPWLVCNVALTTTLFFILPETRDRPCEDTFRLLVPEHTSKGPLGEAESLVGTSDPSAYGCSSTDQLD